MSWLLDTCAISEYAKRAPNRNVIAWLDAPTIVGDRDPCAPEIRSAVDPDDTGAPRLQIFEGIFDEVRE